MKRLVSVILMGLFTCGFLTGAGNMEVDSVVEVSPEVEVATVVEGSPEVEVTTVVEGSPEVGVSDYTAGTITATDYFSEWLGIRYTLSGDLVMATDDEINDMMKLVIDEFLIDDETGEILIDYSEIPVVYEMMATDLVRGCRVLILTEKLMLPEMTELLYIEGIKDFFELMDTTFLYSDVTTRTVSGIEFAELSYVAEKGNDKTRQTYLIKTVGDRIFIIVLVYPDQRVLDELLVGFSAIE